MGGGVCVCVCVCVCSHPVRARVRVYIVTDVCVLACVRVYRLSLKYHPDKVRGTEAEEKCC